MSDLVVQCLNTDEADISDRWQHLLDWFEQKFERKAGIEAILFLVGVQSRGRGFEPKLSKKAKQDLIMEGTHCVFETVGLYERIGEDSKGNTIWQKSVPAIPKLPLPEQEKLLRVAILSYFDLIEKPT